MARIKQNPIHLAQGSEAGKLDSQCHPNFLSDSNKGLTIPKRPSRRWAGRAGTNEHRAGNPIENG
jgi:hypothetical protein